MKILQENTMHSVYIDFYIFWTGIQQLGAQEKVQQLRLRLAEQLKVPSGQVALQLVSMGSLKRWGRGWWMAGSSNPLKGPKGRCRRNLEADRKIWRTRLIELHRQKQF